MGGPQTNWGCYGHTYEVARANGAEYHTCWIKNDRPTLGARQNGFCVTSNGGDQNSNVVRSSDYWANLYSSSCKDWCDLQSGITGCEFICQSWKWRRSTLLLDCCKETKSWRCRQKVVRE